jgi:uncharacterized Fe-S cluster-containing protein
MGPTYYEHNKQLITLTVITISNFHCSSCEDHLGFPNNNKFIKIRKCIFMERQKGSINIQSYDSILKINNKMFITERCIGIVDVKLIPTQIMTK